MRFILDENFAADLAKALSSSGAAIDHVTSHFPKGSADEEFYPLLAEKGWYLVTRDVTIARSAHKRAAFMAAGIGGFFFTGAGSHDRFQLATSLFNRYKQMVQFAERNKVPFCCGVPERGALRRM